MRWHTSAAWDSLVIAASKVYQWRIYARLVSDVSFPVITGAGGPDWIDVTPYITDFTEPGYKIEYEVGQFTADSVTFNAKNIAWWNANIFTSSFIRPNYIEVKIEFSLGLSDSNMASDTCIAYSGFVKDQPKRVEGEDSVEFSAYTAEDIAADKSAMMINTQYIDSVTGGLTLPILRGIYVTDAAISSYVLHAGTHSIAYDYNAGECRAKLDDGDWTTLPTADGYVVLVTKDGTQKIQIYIIVNGLLQSSAELTDIVIVQNEGDTLPRQLVFGLSADKLFDLVYGAMGINTVMKDALTLATCDGRKALSCIDYPPGSATAAGNLTALENTTVDLFVAIGKKIYVRNQAANTYNSVVDLSDSTAVIKKMMFNLRNLDLWIFYSASAGDCLRKYNISTLILSSQFVLSATRETISKHALELVDVNYTGSSWKYGVLWAKQESPAVLRIVDSSMASSVVYTYPSGTNYIGESACFMYTMAANAFCIILYKTSAGQNMLYKWSVNAAGAWTYYEVMSGFPNFGTAAYSQSEDRIYYYEPLESITSNLKSVNGGAIGSSVSAPVTVLSDVMFIPGVQFISSNGGSIYTSVPDVPSTIGRSATGTLYKINANLPTIMDDSSLVCYTGMTTLGATTYGVDWFGRLFQISTTLRMFHDYFDYTKMTIRDYLNKLLNSYLLLGCLSAGKYASIYRRGDDTGTPKNSLSYITIDRSNASNISDNTEIYRSVDIVQISNGKTSTSYDGTRFGASVLINARPLSLTNEMIPSNILKDVCKFVYQFFKSDRTMFTIPLTIPAFQYEPFDGATLSLSTSKIPLTGDGIIYACKYHKDATMEIEVLR